MILNVNNLCEHKILNNVSFKAESFLAIIGPSGAGKTTLLRCIAGLEKYQGSITLDKEPIKNIGMVNQDLALFPHLSVYENIALPLKIRKQNTGAAVDDLLEKFNIKNLAEKLPQNISGGEQQRVAIARALIYKPKILLLDEPFAQLDSVLRYDLLHWLKQTLEAENILTLFVTHNIKEADFFCTEKLFLDKGRVHDWKSDLAKKFLQKTF